MYLSFLEKAYTILTMDEFNHTTSSVAKHRPPKFKVYIRVAMLLLLVGVGGALFAWWRSLNGANYGFVQPAVPTITEEQPAVQGDDYTVLDLQTVQLAHPRSFQVQATQSKNTAASITRLLIGKMNESNERAQIGVTLKPVTAGGITNESSYRRYAQQPSLYTQKVTSNQTVFEKKTGEYDTAIFATQGNQALIIVITAAKDTDSRLANMVDKIAKSIAWQ